MLRILLVLIGVPLIELYILIEVGSGIGALSTIGICILTAVLGTALLRQQGFQTLRRAQRSLAHRQIPALELLEGAALLLGGLMLLFPGFATDALGFACLLPPSRRLLIRVVLRRAGVRQEPIDRGPADVDRDDPPRIIEVDWERKDPHR